MIGMLVGDQDGVEVIQVAFYGGQACQRFAFTEASVYKDAGAFGLEQRQVARTSRSQDRYA